MTDTQTGAPTPTAALKTALSRELSEFLVELSIGVHRFSMYPSNHPSLRPVVEAIVVGIADLVSPGESLAIGVANRQLIIEGISTDRKHPVLSDLAKKLHQQQIGALTLEHGLRATEIEGLLGTLAAATDEDAELIGLMEEIPSWPHIRLHPIGFDRLRLREGEGASTADQAGELWIGLARAVLAGGSRGGAPTPELESYDPRLLAAEIDAKPKEAAYDQVISGYLRQLAGQLKGSHGDEADRIRMRVTSLVREMDESTLTRLVEMGGDVAARDSFVLDANQCLAVDAVVKVLRSAASASGQSISTSMTRLLTKLSRHGDSGSSKARAQASSALRENVEELLADWKLEDPNPDDYTRVLDTMANASPLFARDGGMQAGIDDDAAGVREDDLPGCLRVLRMALEVDAWGETVRTALIDATALGRTAEILALLEEAPEGNETAHRIRRHITDPEQVRRLLEQETVEEDALRALVEEMGHERAVIPLLDGMAESESRSVRRVVFDTLVSMGDVVGPIAAERLPEEERWFVQRNLIALLAKLPTVPREVEIMSFLSSGEPRIRREALPLAFRVPVARDRALGLGLADTDERVCRMALHELREGVPKAILPTLLNRVVKGDRSTDIRAFAIRALYGNDSRLVRDTLLELCTAGKTLLGKPKLTEADPAVAEALKLLAREWSDDSDASAVVEVARKSKEVLHRRAVETAEENTT